jgi:hypothetical protein
MPIVIEKMGVNQGGGNAGGYASIPGVISETASNPAAPSRPEYQTGLDTNWLAAMTWRPKDGKW